MQLVEAPGGKNQADRPAGKAERHAFREQLANDVATAGAQGTLARRRDAVVDVVQRVSPAVVYIGTEQEVQQLRDASEEFSEVLRDMNLLQERIKLLQEELGAYLAERTSRSLFLLTVATVIALPINILAGLFGMNVGGVPLAGHPYGFWLVAALVLAFTCFAGWLAFRRVRDER